MDTGTTGTKRRLPPTFQHLPLNRAKKLKQSWVEVQKVRSHWKAQKRKEGLVTRGRERPWEIAGDASGSAEPGEGSKGNNQRSDVPSGDERHTGDDEEADSDDNESSDDPESSTQPISHKPERPKDRSVPETADEQKPSLRELSRQAYSRSALHHNKSDPLHRHGSSASRGRERPGRGAARGRGAHAERGRGKGQPDMRLRMNVMLEKIKRDLA